MKNTLAIIKPNAMQKGSKEDIRKDIMDNGFKIVEEKTIHMSEQQAQGFYDIHKDKPFFGELVEFMTSFKSHIMKLEKDNAVSEWRDLMGATDSTKAEPGTIRADFAKSIDANAVHGSDSLQSAAREIDYFFKEEEIMSL